jgi:2'-5' RNA ligase
MADAGSLRTFIAIDLPPAVRQRVLARRQALQQRLAGQELAGQDLAGAWRWTPPANLHLTLRFLGAAAPAALRALERLLAAAARQTAPFLLDLGGLGAFQSLRRPTVLWLALSGDLAALAALQARTERAAEAAGFAPEPRPFTPHLTLARARKDAFPSHLARTGDILRTLIESKISGAEVSRFKAGEIQAGGAETGRVEGGGSDGAGTERGSGEGGAAERGGTERGGTERSGSERVGADATDRSAESFLVSEIHLIASELRPTGSVYTPVASFTLLGGDPGQESNA